MGRDLAEVGVDGVLARPEVVGGDDRGCACPITEVGLARPQRFADVRLARPGDDGHASVDLPAYNLDGPASLFLGEAGEFAGGAVDEEAVDAAVDQPVDEPSQF